MISKQHAIIFDLDGVIIDSSSVMKIAFEYAFKQFYPDKSAPFDVFLTHAGKGLLNILNEMNLHQEMAPLFQAKSVELVPKITIFAGIIPLLDALKNNNCYLGIATGKDRFRTDQILRKHNLTHYFDKVICSDELNHSKPNPESLQMHLQYSNIKNNKMVFIGDSIADLKCAKSANISSVGALWGMGNFKDLLNEAPDYVAFDVPDLQWILSLRGMLDFSGTLSLREHDL